MHSYIAQSVRKKLRRGMVLKGCHRGHNASLPSVSRFLAQVMTLTPQDCNAFERRRTTRDRHLRCNGRTPRCRFPVVSTCLTFIRAVSNSACQSPRNVRFGLILHCQYSFSSPVKRLQTPEPSRTRPKVPSLYFKISALFGDSIQKRS